MAAALLAALPLAGRVVTGDALYCQRDLCRQIRQAQGDYLFIVKDNQPELAEAITRLFRDPPWDVTFDPAESWDQHGDRSEHRQVWGSTALNAYLAWPGLRQVGKVVRTCWQRERQTQEVRYVVTSRGPCAATPSDLLRWTRSHWGIENRWPWVRDVTMGEDGCQVRTGAAPQVLAALRNAVLGLVRSAGWTNVAAAHRHDAWCPADTFTLLGLPSSR